MKVAILGIHHVRQEMSGRIALRVGVVVTQAIDDDVAGAEKEIYAFAYNRGLSVGLGVVTDIENDATLTDDIRKHGVALAMPSENSRQIYGT